MENPLDKLTEWGALYGTRILGAAAILVIGRIVVGLLIKIIDRVVSRAQVDVTLARFLSALTEFALLTFVVLAALYTLGVHSTSLIAVIGATGLAIGFALQGSLGNKRVITPNGKITSDSIVNYSAEGTPRVDMVFGISYASTFKRHVT